MTSAAALQRLFALAQGFFIWNQKSLISCAFSQILNFPSQMHFHAAHSRQMKMPCAPAHFL